jgi:O-antigen ligase
MSIPSLTKLGKDYYVLLDIREILIFLLVPFLLLYKKIRIKDYLILLLVIIYSTTFLAVNIIISYLITKDRILTWNETFFADAILLAMIMIFYLKSTKIKLFLSVFGVLCFFAMLFTQTRSIWLSCVICAVILLIIELFRNFNLKKILKSTSVLIVAVLVIISMGSIFKNTITNLVVNRFSEFEVTELINPASSTGYRMYESYMVIRNATLFGHGAGARLFLVDTQGKKLQWHYWWSIHCEYFEILHKFGYIGLGLFLAFLLVYFWRAFMLVLHPKKLIHTIGLVSMLIMLQHCIVSITSGYLIRDNIVPFLVILIILVEIGWIQRKKYNNIRLTNNRYLQNE